MWLPEYKVRRGGTKGGRGQVALIVRAFFLLTLVKKGVRYVFVYHKHIYLWPICVNEAIASGPQAWMVESSPICRMYIG